MSQPQFMRRFIALLRKEVRQMLRDKSNLAVGLLLPISSRPSMVSSIGSGAVAAW